MAGKKEKPKHTLENFLGLLWVTAIFLYHSIEIESLATSTFASWDFFSASDSDRKIRNQLVGGRYLHRSAPLDKKNSLLIVFLQL